MLTSKERARLMGLASKLPTSMHIGKNGVNEGVAAQFLISVPKRRLRHAVDRVTVRRRIREAYRLNRALLSTPVPIDVAFIYLADSVVASDKIHRAMRRLLAEMSQKEVEQ